MTESRSSGLIQLYTGDGKGKTTAALGLCLRACGHGMRCGFFCFMKKGWNLGEIAAADRLEGLLRIHELGEGPGFVTGKPTKRQREAASHAFSEVLLAIHSGEYDLIVLDELVTAVDCGLIDESDLFGLLAGKPQHIELVLTGRNASDSLVTRCDLVTEMRMIKHPYDHGVCARRGIEY